MSDLETTIALLEALVAFPTISSDSNMDAITFLAGHLERSGARVEVLRDASGQKANLWATLGPEIDGGLVLSGHSDVVPVAEQDWSSDPFVMTRRNGRLYGRGTCDMKGFIAACVAMAPHLAKSARHRPIHFAFTHDEEVGCLGGRALVEALSQRGIRPAMALIGEPTQMQVIEGHKGCCEYTVRFSGAEGHGSAPDRGVNAVEYASRYIARLMQLRQDLIERAPQDSPFDPPYTTINVGALHGGHAHNVIPGAATLEWEMRPINDADMAFVKSRIDSYCRDTLLPQMRDVAADADILTEIIGEVAGLVPMPVNAMRDTIQRLTGANGASCVPFGTEAGLFQQLGIQTVICGPGSIEQAHKPDEYVEIDQLSQCLTLLHKLGAAHGAASDTNDAG
ncbi:acetylornithine deacetylase [Pseudooceanicola sediminis]|uniref:Acetylornithine deacetylase n=1 Tax=Pseudooceanicola sediminis TaxID=2211117 RepID=A0A399J8I1_9RHOB|nr:acetylornithine deacetylase [Pseudooceanicola sediminis]KAA2317142.1 acetylornithine deacetylase [Puniceibacterium sp. HSS470]RII40509.1 acetylornithine deacetylase [Pseudooceanicola sediminis]|tara:strand:- start:108434 stop:109618 length:1185 start_codon:yes stop_codon:yes gene_type:complete